MAVVTETRERTDRRPYEAHAAIIMGTFLGGIGLAGVAARIFHRNPACQTPLDLAVLSLASFEAARTIARNEVTSFLREPFVEAGRGRRRASRSRRSLAPRRGRLLTWSLAAAGANDFLQAAFAALTQKSNELEQRAEI